MIVSGVVCGVVLSALLLVSSLLSIVIRGIDSIEVVFFHE